MLLACLSSAVRGAMPRLLALAPLPGLAAAAFALHAPALEIGAGRLRLVFELDGPGALLLGVAALLWSAAGAYAASYMRDTAKPGRFVACWLMACTGCLGVFVAGDLVSLYAMLAMLTLGASGLVIHDETPQAWRAGSIYLVLALLAESVLLVGLVMLAGEIPGDSLSLRDAAAADRSNIGVRIGYDEALAHRIIAGADSIVVPSRFEPCGLTQLYGLRYGTLPLVRRVGGLADTVVDASPGSGAPDRATGFTFDEPTAAALASAFRRVGAAWRDPALWSGLMQRAMAQDFSWESAARAYLDLYRTLLPAEAEGGAG